MCDIIDAVSSPYMENATGSIPDDEPNAYAFSVLTRELDISFDPSILDRGGEIYCRHPGTDWHKMEVPKDKMLHCPAETEIKVVFPVPVEEIQRRSLYNA